MKVSDINVTKQERLEPRKYYNEEQLIELFGIGDKKSPVKQSDVSKVLQNIELRKSGTHPVRFKDGEVVEIDPKLATRINNWLAKRDPKDIKSDEKMVSSWEGFQKIAKLLGIENMLPKPKSAYAKSDDELDRMIQLAGLGEGYYKLPDFDSDKYQERDGLEGPIPTRSGKVLYYDPKEGMYYDPDTDMFVDYDEFRKYDEVSWMDKSQDTMEAKPGDSMGMNKYGISAVHKDGKFYAFRNGKKVGGPFDTIEQLADFQKKSIENESYSPWTSTNKHPETMNRRELEQEIEIFKQQEKVHALDPGEQAQLDSLYYYLENLKDGEYDDLHDEFNELTGIEENNAQQELPLPVNYTFTKTDFLDNEAENMHTENAVELAMMFGTKEEQKRMNMIMTAHNTRGYILPDEQEERDALVRKYYPMLEDVVAEEEDNTYTVVHAKHGKEEIKAPTSYAAAKKFADMKKLKNTAGVDAHLHTKEDDPNKWPGDKKVDNDPNIDVTTGKQKKKTVMGFNVDSKQDKIDAKKGQIALAKRNAPKSGLTTKDVPKLEKELADLMKEDDNEGFTDKQIKQAFGVLNDKRYHQGNYSGAVATIEKIAKGLSKHPSVANALKRANEDINEYKTDKVQSTYDAIMKGIRNRGPAEESEVGDYIPSGMTGEEIRKLIDKLEPQGYDKEFLLKDLAPMMEEDPAPTPKGNSVLDRLRLIVKDKQNAKVQLDDGHLTVDLYTASAITQVYDKVNDTNKAKMEKMMNTKEGLVKLTNAVFGMLNKGKMGESETEGVIDENVLNSYRQLVEKRLNESVPGATEEDEVKQILNKYDVTDIEEIEYASPVYDELFDYYSNSGEMPYGVMKARDGMPDEWIVDRVLDLGLLEAKLTKAQIKKRDKIADKMPDAEFKKRYGKDADAVKYGAATNMVKDSVIKRTMEDNVQEGEQVTREEEQKLLKKVDEFKTKDQEIKDIEAKEKALQDIQMNKHTKDDPELQDELKKRKAELDRLKKLAGV